MRHAEKVFALLLEFAELPEKFRREFLMMINEFLLMSPAQKRRTISEWRSRDGSDSRDLPGDSSSR
nr:hypothetical protein [Burkholderia anthina]